MEHETAIPSYSKEDYLTTTTPFEWLYQFKEDKLKLKQMTTILSEQAKGVGVKNFIGLFKIYRETVASKTGLPEDNVTDFDGQPAELACGSWVCDDYGVSTTDKYGFEVVACNHPILPVQRLVNIDTGEEKLKLAYRKNKQWRYYIADKKTLASNNKILELAGYGVAVNSENAKYLVKYLTDIEDLNYDRIEELNSVGRLGWIDGYGFSPYVEDLVFDGDLSYKHFFESVRTHGDFGKWLDLVSTIRRGGVIARMVLAASFASVLVNPCGAQPFFVHLWGGTEAGKTVALMLAASVWASPKMGDYIHTFNSTSVGQELSAGFVNSLPLILDELQIVGDKKDFDKTIYLMAEGVGRSRGAKSGGLQKVASWQNCILTNGEQPISSNSSAGGAVNRIVEIDCKDEKLFGNPVHVVEVVSKNFGYAGKLFVQLLLDEQNMQHAIKTQKQLCSALSNGEATEKQAMAASVILAADKLMDEWIFRDGCTLDAADIVPFLSTKKQVSANERALEYLYDCVSINQNRFLVNSFGEYPGEVWGCMDEKYIYIIKAQFDKLMLAEGYNPAAFLSWAKRQGLIEAEQTKNTKNKRVAGSQCRCVWLKQMQDEPEGPLDVGDIPY